MTLIVDAITSTQGLNMSHTAIVSAAGTDALRSAPPGGAVVESSLGSHAENVLAKYLPIDRIEPEPGFNPRVYRDPVEQQKLTDSIKELGYVIEPITVRPAKSATADYRIVAGNGRWLGAKDAGHCAILCVVRDLTDREALAVAMTENTHRSAMSPAEEAMAARRLLDCYEGDREEVCRRLGWSAQLLASRLLLLHANEDVLIALAERRIDLGHAEHLSPLEPAKQSKALLTILKHRLTVADVRKHIAAFALDLATAAFDRDECGRCPHNTTLQASLFEANIGEGRCANPECFQRKTDAHVAELRVGLREQFNTVFLDTEKDPAKYHVLLARDVGMEQLETGCKQCKNFGCLLSTRPGDVGHITHDVCFGPSCREEKMAAYRPKVPATPGGSTAQARPAATATPSSAARAKTCVATPVPPRRVEEFIFKVHHRAAAAAVADSVHMGKVYAVLALLNELGEVHMPAAEHDMLEQIGIKRPRSGDVRAGLIAALHARSPQDLDALITALAARIAGQKTRHPLNHYDYLLGAQNTLRVMKTNLADHFVVDAEFLRLHTKAGIGALLAEAGVPAHYATHRRQKEYAQLLSGKHEDLVAGAMSCGFEFTGFVPKSVSLLPAS